MLWRRWRRCSPPSCPTGDGWQYEPKWDGFRCLARRDGDEVTLTSKSGKPLGRYFPEVVEMLALDEGTRVPARRRADHPVGDALAFDALQLRLHPAESRIRKLAAETPAELMAFDLLELGGKSLIDRAAVGAARSARALLRARTRSPACSSRPRPPTATPRSTGCSAAAARWTGSSPSGSTRHTARASGRWSRSSSSAPPTASSAASAMREKTRVVGSLLLGLYDDDGLLDHVGFTSAIPAERAAGADKEARSHDRAARLHRQRAGRSEPLEHGADLANGSR